MRVERESEVRDVAAPPKLSLEDMAKSESNDRRPASPPGGEGREFKGIETATVKGMMPRVGATCFHAEVVGIRVSGNAGREASTFLLTAAGMRAIGEYLVACEDSQ